MRHIAKSFLIVVGFTTAGCAGGNVIDEAVPQAAFGDAGVSTADTGSGSTHSGGTVPAEVVDANSSTDLAASALDRTVDPAAASETDSVFAGTGTAVRTGTYPNMNVEPRGATAQMTDGQRDILLEEMQALAAAHQAGKVSSADYRRRLALLRRLAETHSLEVLEKIEK